VVGHVTDAMHPALQWKNSDLKPSGDKVSRQQPLLLQLGDSVHLGVDVAVADTVFARPLKFLSRPRKRELRQVEEVGAVVWRLDVEERRLPVLA
jgi:hypothetical protein